MSKQFRNECQKIGMLFAKQIAKRNVNTSCPWFSYQAKLPKSVKELKKHN